MNTSQVQKQILAPTMQQSIEVLLLPIIDLNLAIEQELQENPLLELDEEIKNASPSNLEEELRQRLSRLRQDFPMSPSYEPGEDEMYEEKPIRKDESLEELLLRQLRVEFSDPLPLKIGELVIGNIDEDGYLTVTCSEIAEILGIKDLLTIEHVLKIIQTFEPLGIASRNLEECLSIQAQEKMKDTNNLIFKMIQQFLKELGQKKYPEIAKKLNVSLSEVKEVARMISSFDPRPARNYRPINGNIYIKPDVYIIKNEENDYQIQINEEGIPALRVNSFYTNMLKKSHIKPEEKEFILEKLKNALHFIKSIEQRGQTVKAIAQYILDKQKDFFEKGHMSLTPMSLKNVAESLSRNESTISRAINNKYLETPIGLYPMKFFFSQSVGNDHNNPKDVLSVSNRSIKEEIKELILSEDKSAPFSDQDIQEYFKGKDIKVARRTINKYRQTLNILPAHLRKQYRPPN